MITNEYKRSKNSRGKFVDKCLKLNGKLVAICWKKTRLENGAIVWGYLKVLSKFPFKAILLSLKKNRYLVEYDQVEFITGCKCDEGEVEL